MNKRIRPGTRFSIRPHPEAAACGRSLDSEPPLLLRHGAIQLSPDAKDNSAVAINGRVFAEPQYATSRGGRKAAEAAELSIIIPTLNERDNILPLLGLLDAALADIRWEVMFVDDDSGDGTADLVRSIARADNRVRCIQRIRRRGLSTACIEGVLASASTYIAVMDADMQHDERLLPKMLETLKSGPYDLVVGSRYMDGGGIGDWDRARAHVSDLATRLSRTICKTEIADPMSGFFMFRRAVFEAALRNLSGQGFKILLDLLASSSQKLRVKELPFQFRQRLNGASKLDTLVALEFGLLLLDKLTGRAIPARLALFGFVGALGLLIHLTVLRCGLTLVGASFIVSQALAAIAATTFTFLLNNVLTHKDKRLRGIHLVRGLVSFHALGAVGAAANLAIAYTAFGIGEPWWAAGAAGALTGALWNYSVAPALARRND